MEDKEADSQFHRRANKVREIAKGIFDKTERRFLMKFVSDCEKLVAPPVLRSLSRRACCMSKGQTAT
jgi:hypothetical protein